MLRLIMALKVTHTAASSWAARHQADEAGTMLCTLVFWNTRLALEQ